MHIHTHTPSIYSLMLYCHCFGVHTVNWKESFCGPLRNPCPDSLEGRKCPNLSQHLSFYYKSGSFYLRSKGHVKYDLCSQYFVKKGSWTHEGHSSTPHEECPVGRAALRFGADVCGILHLPRKFILGSRQSSWLAWAPGMETETARERKTWEISSFWTPLSQLHLRRGRQHPIFCHKPPLQPKGLKSQREFGPCPLQLLKCSGEELHPIPNLPAFLLFLKIEDFCGEQRLSYQVP